MNNFKSQILYICTQLSKDGSRYGQNTEADFGYLSNNEKYQKVVQKTLKQLQKLWNIPKFEGPGSKTKPAMPIYILESKGPSFAQF